MRQMCVLLMVLGVLLCGAAQAGLYDPALINPSFEDPALDAGTNSGDINDWYDGTAYTYTADDGAATHPETPYGDNWSEFGQQRWMYQQIGTYDGNTDLVISFLMGARGDKGPARVVVALLVGGDPLLAADANVKIHPTNNGLHTATNPLIGTVGATLITMTDEIAPFSGTALATSEQTIMLSTGTGYTVGDPLWLQVWCPITTSGRLLIDNVEVSFPTAAGAVSPANGQENLPITTDALPEEASTTLVWNAPMAYTGAEFNIFFGTTEPNYLFADYGLTQLNTGGIITDTAIDPSPSSDLDYETTYYWVVDSYEPNLVTGTPTLHRGSFWTFSTISEIPVIATEPVTATIQSGETTVDLTIDAVSTDVYEWFRVGTSDVSVQTTGSLGTPLGTDTYAADTEGYYYCIVSNASYAVQSDTVFVMTPRLVAHWDFENTLDSTDGVYTGTYVDPNEFNLPPAETYTAVDDPTNLNGQAFIFDGDNNGGMHVQIDGDPNDFNFYPQGYTVSAWVKTSEGGYGSPVAKQALDKNQGFLLNHFDGSAIHTLRNTSVSVGASINNDQWRMMTGTYDAATMTVMLFVDGIEIGSAVRTSIPLTNDQPLIFGIGLTDASASPYSGQLDEVSIWNYPRTPEEIAWDYNDFRLAGTSPPCVDGIGLLYDVAGGPLDAEGNPTPDCYVDLADFVEIIAVNWLNCREASASCITDPR